MPRNRFKAEGTISKLRAAEVVIAQGKTVFQACKQIWVMAQTLYRGRKRYGGLRMDQAKRFKDVERKALV